MTKTQLTEEQIVARQTHLGVLKLFLLDQLQNLKDEMRTGYRVMTNIEEDIRDIEVELAETDEIYCEINKIKESE